MLDLLPAWPLLAAFLLASLVLALTPGPAVIYILTRTLSQGREAGLASVAAVAVGNLGNALGAAIGLAALFAASTLAFTVVKYAGAAYLIYLGIRALRGNGGAAVSVPDVAAGGQPASVPGRRRTAKVFRDGVTVALLNPKTTLFFAAFLPQFMDPALAAMPQSIALGGMFVVVAATSDVCYVLAASALLPMLARARGAFALGRYLSGAAFIGLGVFTALSGGRKPA